MDIDYNEKDWATPCPKYDCRKTACKCGLEYVNIPTSLGDDSEGSSVAPKNGAYCNALVVYEANGHVYIYTKEGIPTLMDIDASEISFNDILHRPKYNGRSMESSTNIPKVPTAISELTNDSDYQTSTEVAGAVSTEATARQNADTAIENKLDRTVMTDLNVNSNQSTSVVQLDADKVNLKTGATSTKNIPLPVASSAQAGVMNSATFDAISDNANNINALMNGAVAVTGLGATPTQAELTTAWQNETGLSTLMNRASIYDVTNNKVWTYYTNDTTWHESSNTSQVAINTFTNSSEGVIKGSTSVGQVFAESNGTGSVNGWDSLSSSVSTNTGNITSLQNGKQDKLTAGTNITISDNTISATGVNDPDYVHTDNNFTDALKTKLEGLENYEARGYGLTELKVRIDAENGDDNNDGSDWNHAMKTIKAAILRYANKEHKYEMKLYLASGNTYTIDGYILNGVSLHFESARDENVNTIINITTLGSNYSFAFYNSHVNFVGSSTRPIVVNMANTSTADSVFYLDSGNMQSSYTTFNCGVTLWSASARFQHCTLNRKLRVNYCSVQLQESAVSSIECVAGQIDAWKTTINTNKADNTDGYYWLFRGSILSLYGNTYVNIDTTPTVSNFFHSDGSTIYIGAVLNKNNGSTKKFSGTNTIYGGVISSLQNRYDSLKAMAVSSNVRADVIKSSGLTV